MENNQKIVIGDKTITLKELFDGKTAERIDDKLVTAERIAISDYSKYIFKID